MPEIAYVDGKIMPVEKARVPVEDRGYQFGDAVYEFIASYNGRLFALEAHLDRLENSLGALAFPAISRDHIRETLLETCSQAGIERAGVYLQISRGTAPRNHAYPDRTQPHIVITVRPVPKVSGDLRTKGAHVITVADIRWGRCDIKTVQLLPNVMAKQQAIESGADDAIFVSRDGIVREGTASNVFIVKKGKLKTHPLTAHILPGITRAILMVICSQQNWVSEEHFFHKSEMIEADEVFLTGTVTEVLPVVQVDGQTIGQGAPGPVARRLFNLLRERAEA